MEYLVRVTDYFQPLAEGGFYHIYNRGNNGEPIFFQERNYTYFLNKLNDYVGSYLNFYAYCLLPNHFHFLVQIKKLKEISPELLQLPSGNKTLNNLETIVSEQFRRFFLSYSKSIKVQEGRTGSLFEKNFKRKQITNDQHLDWLVNYIHRNPETHGFINDFRNYSPSSYKSFLT
ncbi:MAG TPA: hypothetical protein VEV15_05830, partial [Flavisolibacter sp.]|nr:hypothetical protein [Flavisolibacter sp.]